MLPDARGSYACLIRRRSPKTEACLQYSPVFDKVNSPQDVKKLVLIFDHLIQLGATVIVIEHDLELVTNCDYIIDMGPWGGTEGGRVVVEGTPEAVAATSESITGRYLKQELAEDK